MGRETVNDIPAKMPSALQHGIVVYHLEKREHVFTEIFALGQFSTKVWDLLWCVINHVHRVYIFMPPTLKKIGGPYCFWLVCSIIHSFVRVFVRHAFWCIA